MYNSEIKKKKRIHTLDINEATAEDFEREYGVYTPKILGPNVTSVMSVFDDMRELFLYIETERDEGGDYLSTKDFLQRMYRVLKEQSMEYPALMLESLARGCDLRFPDGNSENMHYALLALGMDYHKDLVRRLEAGYKIAKNNVVDRNFEFEAESESDKAPF